MNRELWQTIYENNYEALVRSMRGQLNKGNPSEAEDIVQSVFTRLMAKYPDNVDHIINVGAILQTSVINDSKDRLKHTIRTIDPINDSKEFSELRFATQNQPIESEVTRIIQLQELAAAIRRLPTESAEVMELLSQGFLYKEIALKLNLPENTVSSRIKRAKESMLKENRLFK